MKKLEELQKKVFKTIKENKLIKKGDKIVLGVSGRQDSMCMLDVLIHLKVELKFEIVVAHINHLIREEANQDELYVRGFCQKKQLEFYSKSIDVKKIAHTNKIGTEEAGRKVRYEFFDEIAKQTGANKIAVAHNKNDKIETILMHLMRGSGILGLKGIEAKKGNLIRPLINCQRVEIEKYCEEKVLNPKIDKTNVENIYTRNKIRNILIPLIQKEFNPNIVETLNRLSELVAEEDEYIHKQTILVYQDMLEKEITFSQSCQKGTSPLAILDLKKFNAQEKVIKARIILYTITRLFGNSSGIEKIHIEDIIKLCQNNIGNKFLTPNKKIKVLVKNHQIYFISQI